MEATRVRISSLSLGLVDTNTYFIENDKQVILVDPASDSELIIKKLNQINKSLKAVLLTHAHFDHIGALEELVNYAKAKVIINKNDYNMLIGKEENYCDMLFVKQPNLNVDFIIPVEDGYSFNVGSLEFETINTKGHSSR